MMKMECIGQTASERSFRSLQPHHECLRPSLLHELARVGAAIFAAVSIISRVFFQHHVASPGTQKHPSFKRFRQTYLDYLQTRPSMAAKNHIILRIFQIIHITAADAAIILAKTCLVSLIHKLAASS
jgi:hypothetical protein